MQTSPDPSPLLRLLSRLSSISLSVWLPLLLLLLAGCESGTAPEPAPGLRRVALALNWFPEAEHGGFYAAQVHGHFADEGLEVEILPGGPGAPVIQQVASGRVDFAVANADQVLLGRDQGAPVVAVMTAMQHSPRCIMVHERSGIRSFAQLRGLTLAVGSGKPFAKYLLDQLGEADLEIVPYQGSVATFLQREDFAQQAYVFSEPFVARQQGGDPHCLMVSELGFDPYTSLLITNDQLVEAESALVKKVVRACRRGWKDYLDAPERTNEYIHQQNEEMSLEILKFGAEQIRPLCLAARPAAAADESGPAAGLDSVTIGRMDPARWELLAEQLVQVGLLKSKEIWRAAFDNRFLADEAGGAAEAGEAGGAAEAAEAAGKK